MNNNIDLHIKGLKCDAEGCDYRDNDINSEQYEHYVDSPCPECGASLLTKEDFESVKYLQDLVGAINTLKLDDDEQRYSFSGEMDGTGSITLKEK